MPTLLPLRDLARETAVEILADAAGRRRISELLAVAYLRGYSEAMRDQNTADIRRRMFDVEQVPA
jgi:tRNA threonylcarbamoyladenosine modification (KEOPS) complex Cgi121 subunit